MIAAHPNTGVLLWVSRTTRKCWQHQNASATTCPHTAFVRRAPQDVRHMLFSIALAAHLKRAPERTLSCWRKHSVVTDRLNVREQAVLGALFCAAGVSGVSQCTLTVTDGGISLSSVAKLDGSVGRSRRAITFSPVANYDADAWTLYLRLLLLPAATRENHGPDLYGPLPYVANRHVAMRRRWTPGRVIRVYRSTRGFHACHYLHEDRPPRGAFLLLLVGVMRHDHRIDVTAVNLKHPLAALVDNPHCVSRSDLNDLTFRPDSWP